MILDSLPQWRRYASLNPRFSSAFTFLERIGQALAVGRHDIDHDRVYALVQRYQTRPVAGMQLEMHRRYIDIQYVVSGCEAIHWAPRAGLVDVTMPYDVSKDATLFAAPADMVPIPVHVGQFAILFPDDAHAPCCTWGEPAEVLKVVVKVEVDGYRA